MSSDGLLHCPFCQCCFTSQPDLTAHLKAMIEQVPPSNCPPINERDHKRVFERLHRNLEYSGEWDQ